MEGACADERLSLIVSLLSPPALPGLCRVCSPWTQGLRDGRYGGTAETAERFKLNDTHVRRLLRFADLAPDIVEAIVEGRQPRALTVRRLLQGFHARGPISARNSDSPAEFEWHDFLCDVSSNSQFHALLQRELPKYGSAGRGGSTPISLTA